KPSSKRKGSRSRNCRCASASSRTGFSNTGTSAGRWRNSNPKSRRSSTAGWRENGKPTASRSKARCGTSSARFSRQRRIASSPPRVSSDARFRSSLNGTTRPSWKALSTFSTRRTERFSSPTTRATASNATKSLKPSRGIIIKLQSIRKPCAGHSARTLPVSSSFFCASASRSKRFRLVIAGARSAQARGYGADETYRGGSPTSIMVSRKKCGQQRGAVFGCANFSECVERRPAADGDELRVHDRAGRRNADRQPQASHDRQERRADAQTVGRQRAHERVVVGRLK